MKRNHELSVLVRHDQGPRHEKQQKVFIPQTLQAPAA